nr:probable arabinosyltransferase ARAD1 [Tanacetum cinerariifolium]
RTQGRDHVIPMHHPNAFRFFREEVNASILIVADFGRYSKVMSNLQKDVVAPYMHVMESFVDDDPPDPYNSRTTLLFFRGRTVRKSEGVVRAKLVKILKGYEDVHYEASYATGDSIKAVDILKFLRQSTYWQRTQGRDHISGVTLKSCQIYKKMLLPLICM